MSVIHQMLTELDARHAPRPPTLDNYTFAALPLCTVDAPYRPLRRWLMAGAALICSAGLAGWFQFAELGTAQAPHDTLDEALAGALIDPPSAGLPTPPPVSTQHTAAPSKPKPRGATALNTPSAPPPPPPAATATSTTTTTASESASAPQLAMLTPPAELTASSSGPGASAVSMLTSASAATSAASIEKRVVPPSNTQRAALAYRQAVELAASGHASQAIDKARESLKAEPDHTAARQLAATLLFENNRLDEATTLLQEGLERGPKQPALVYLLARLKAETGDSAGALATLAQTDELSADGHGLRAVILARQGRYREALPAYEAAARLAPQNASWWLGLGVALEAEGQTAHAVQALQRARALGSLRGELLAFVDQKLAALK